MKKILVALAIFMSVGIAHAEEKQNPALIDMETGVQRPAPAVLEYTSYVQWVQPILEWESGKSALSAFTPHVFAWMEEQKGRPLPPEVFKDPKKIFVNVDRPLQQTIQLEDAGEIEEGNTVGAEVYAEMEGSVEEGLAAMLFLWGRPVGEASGRTYPAASPFARRVEYSAPLPELGEGAFANLTLRRDGGVIKDLADRYILLVRGNAQVGYTVVMQYVRPALKTETQHVFAMALLEPMGEGKFSYRISTRYQGQNYKILGGIKLGRATVGFNREKVRAVAEEYRARIQELRLTGTIKDKKTDIEWGR